MGLNNFNFAQPLWLGLLVFIPLGWGWSVYWRSARSNNSNGLKKYADPELLPHIMANTQTLKTRSFVGLIYSLTISCIIIALADPRWDFKDIEAYAPSASMIILLDLSSTMNAQDVSPSRVIAGRQRVEDLLQQSKGLKVGLIGFAENPHLISPITDDIQTIKTFLPAVDTDLINKQGTSLSLALKAAAELLSSEPGEKKSILLVSDGNLGKDNYEKIVKALAGQNISVHVLGVGTAEGGPYRDQSGKLQRNGDKLIVSKLNASVLQKIARDGRGLYVEANYSDRGLKQILAKVQRDDNTRQVSTGKIRQWEDRYYLLLLPAAGLFLYLLRQRALYSIGIIFLISAFTPRDVSAFEFSSLFRNSSQRAQHIYSQGDFNTAAAIFKDPYQKGVALYRAGEYSSAEEQFKSAQQGALQIPAIYNAGNAQMQQKKWHAAINSYERVLQDEPDHADAKFNLELAKKMLAKNDDQDEEQDEKDKKGQPDTDGKKNEQDQDSDGPKGKKQDQNKDPKSDEQKDQEKKDEPEQQDKDGKDQKDDQDNAQYNEADKSEQQKNPAQDNSTSLDAESQRAQAEKDARAQQWLNRVNSDIKIFLKNKFYIEDMLSSK